MSILDAGAAGMLTGLVEQAEKTDRSLRVVGARGMVLEVLQIVGLDKRLRAYEEPADVLADVRIEAEAGGAAPGASTRWMHAGRWPDGRDDTVRALLRGMAELPPDEPARRDLRAQVIEDAMPFATRLARRFRDRGEPIDDLTQVALLGLVNAVDGYDPQRGCDFVSYATPTILGELRRYFRDKGWRIKVPRRLQERRLQIKRAENELSQELGASPTVADLARHLNVEEDEILEAIEAAKVYSPASLSAPASGDQEVDLVDSLGFLDPGMEAVEYRESLLPAMSKLSRREQFILAMRFFGNMTQSQIAREMGISQMHVSRLLSQTLGQLRNALTEC